MAGEKPRKAHLGKYELLEFLKEDIAGQLYRARDTESGRPVLLKVVAPSVCHNPAFARYFFHKSADHQSLIEHPNVAQVVEVGQEAGTYYVAVEDTGGQQLSDKLTQAPFDPADALNIVRQVAEGLRGAHRREAVHGHLKPSDILLTTDRMGRQLVKVSFLDLGLSAADTVVSVFGEIMGTPKYMAPEVIRGRTPGPQADVFALGVIAYELFTGREPFPSDHAVGYLFSNCEAEAPPADKAAADVPHEVAQVVHRMMEKDPARRYRSMQRVIDDLDRCVQSMKTGHVEVVPYGTDSAFARDYELTRPKAAGRVGRPPWLGPAVALVAVALVVGLLGYVMGRGRAGPERTIPPPPPARKEPPPPPVEVEVTAAPREEVEPPAPEPLPPPPPPEETRETAARKAFENALAEWQRYSRNEDYELGATAFSMVARDYADTPVAVRCKEEMARIYTEWARALSREGQRQGAVDRYEKALEAAPEGSEFAEIARRRLPGAMVQLAEGLRLQGEYDRALEVYGQIAAKFPGTKEAALLGAKTPQILFDKAGMLWRDSGDLDEALAIFLKVIREHADTEWADRAEQTMPYLYLDLVRQQLADEQFREARQQLIQLVEAYRGHPAATDAARLDAEILFHLFQNEQDASQGAAHYGELLRRYPSSPWTVRAARLKLGLQRAEGDHYYDARTARSELKKAQKLADEFDFTGAMGTLKGVIRHAQAESREAAEALAKLPAVLYESALFACGKGSREGCEADLADLAAQFPHTDWQQKGNRTFDRIAHPPEGMVYVPEGPFRMGTDLADIVSLVRTQATSALEGDISTFVEVSGLANETPSHIVSTGAFHIDVTEVTNEQYKEFIAETEAEAEEDQA